MSGKRLAAAGVKAVAKAVWTGWSSLAPAPRIEAVFKRQVPSSIHEPHVEEPGGPFEFVKRACGKLYIEPEWGYVISSNGHLLEEPTAPNFEYTVPRWRLGMPSPVGFVQARRGRARTVRHRSVISLRHPWEWNYYHFYLDVLGKMRIFDELGIDQSTPLVVGRYAMDLPFAQQVLQTGGLKDRTWIVQADTYVLADEVYYCRTKQPHKLKADYFLDLMGVPACRDEFNERVFLTRGPKATRRLANMDEIKQVLHAHDFQIVDVEGWTIAEQIELFSKTRYLIGLHGAGLINVIYRRAAPLSLLELHAEDFRSRDFEDICKQSGYVWDHLGGPLADARDARAADFSIDVGRLEEKIQQMLSARPPGLP